MEVSIMRYKQVALCIIVLAMSGVSLVESGRNNEARIPLFKCELTLGITNQNYNDSLLNTGSVDYLILSLEVKGAFYSIYGCDACKTHKFYRGVSAMTFSNQTGTVLVKATLVFQSNETNAHLVESLLMKAINGSNEINNLKFKPEFSEAISGSTPTTNTTTTSRPTNTTTSRPTNTTTTRPTNTTSTRPTNTTTTRPNNTTTSRPTNTTTTRPSNTTTTRPTNTTTSRPTNTTTTLPTNTTTTRPTNTTTTRPTNTTTTRPTNTTTTLPTNTTTTRPTNTTTTRPTNTTTTRPTNTTTTRPTNTTPTHPTTHFTTKCTGPHNAASSFFYQYPITLTSFLHICVSFFLFFLTSCLF